FGGTVALATALAGKVEVRSVTTFEANPLAVIAERGLAELYAATRTTSDAFEAAWRDGEPDAAGRIIDFWGGPGAFAALPAPIRGDRGDQRRVRGTRARGRAGRRRPHHRFLGRPRGRRGVAGGGPRLLPGHRRRQRPRLAHRLRLPGADGRLCDDPGAGAAGP